MAKKSREVMLKLRWGRLHLSDFLAMLCAVRDE